MISWQAPPSRPVLLSHQVHLWRVSLLHPPLPVDMLWGVLNEEELARAGRYRFERDRRRFVAARGLLRVILARYAGISPAAIRFEYSDYGKPSLPDRPALAFNSTDSGDLMALGVAENRLLGVDIEQVRDDFGGLEIAERFFSSAEVAVLRALPAHEQSRAFFRCWTRKEAFIKAIGEGLSYPLHQFDVTLGPDETPRLLRVAGEPDAPRRWFLDDFPVHQDYEGAIIAEMPVTDVVYWSWGSID